jgi:creatinine amidohydrolase
MTDLAKLTWPEAAELFGPRTIAILPIGSTEPHGPHLPLDTDVTIALAQSRRAAELLEARGVRSLLLPAMPYGITRFTQGFPGGVTLRPGTLWAFLEDLVLSLQQDDVRQLVISNGHLEPAHVKVLRNICVDYSERGQGQCQILFADNTRRRWAQTLSAEFQSGECHAGSYESGIVLAADPDSVRREELAALPPKDVHLIENMQNGVTSFAAMGADQAYCGSPAEASEAEGREQIERLAEMIVTTCEEAWPDLFVAEEA